jgi:predicted Ser/Thr protein kinase
MNEGLPDPYIGRVIGDCLLQAKLGEGAFGRVYRAFSNRLQLEVALKLITGTTHPNALERFKREARAAARLVHPNVARVHMLEEEQGLWYIVQEFVQGENLAARVERAGPLEVGDALELAGGVAAGLAAIHGAGILHRDLKPANVVLCLDGVKIVDFGMARVVEEDSSLTRRGAAIGSPSYAPVEQLGGDVARIGPASDVFALGGVLHFSLTGHAPHEGEDDASPIEMMARRAQGLDADPRAWGREIPTSLAELVKSMLRAEPNERPALIEVQRQLLEVATRPQGLEVSTPKGRAGPGMGWAPKLAAALVVGLAAIGGVILTRTEPPLEPDSEEVAAEPEPPPPVAAPAEHSEAWKELEAFLRENEDEPGERFRRAARLTAETTNAEDRRLSAQARDRAAADLAERLRSAWAQRGSDHELLLALRSFVDAHGVESPAGQQASIQVERLEKSRATQMDEALARIASLLSEGKVEAARQVVLSLERFAGPKGAARGTALVSAHLERESREPEQPTPVVETPRPVRDPKAEPSPPAKHPAPAPARRGVVLLSGSVKTKEKALGRGAFLPPATELTAGREVAELGVDEVRVLLAARSVVRVTAEHRLVLERGKLLVRSGPGDVVLESAEGLVSVKGTCFLDRRNRKTRIVTLEGSARVHTTTKHEVYVRAGTEVRVAARTPPTVSRPLKKLASQLRWLPRERRPSRVAIARLLETLTFDAKVPHIQGGSQRRGGARHTLGSWRLGPEKYFGRRMTWNVAGRIELEPDMWFEATCRVTRPTRILFLIQNKAIRNNVRCWSKEISADRWVTVTVALRTFTLNNGSTPITPKAKLGPIGYFSLAAGKAGLDLECDVDDLRIGVTPELR